MLITNLTILAVELRKLIGADCKADMGTENTLTVYRRGNTFNEFRIGVIITDDICRVEISSGYNIRLEDVADAAAKLRDDDVIYVYKDHVHVHKTYSMTLEQFDSFSVEQIEHVSKDIVGTLKGM